MPGQRFSFHYQWSALAPRTRLALATVITSTRTRRNDRTLVLMQADADYKVPYSRSFTEKSAGQSRPGSTVDTRHVHVYLRRQGSRSSVFSAASAGLANSDNLSLASSAPESRPMSAESEWKLKQANTRIVLPNPTTANRFLQSISSTPPRPPHPSAALCRSASIPLPRRPSYLDKLVCQVLDFLFMGGIEAAYNANLLCRLNIEYLIDISNVEPLKVPRNKRSDCPCLCPLETAHSRARMNIMIDEHSQIDLVPYFDDVNRFIESARSRGKNVLVHSYHGRNRCAALIAQYLMKTKNVGFDRAVQLLKGIRADVCIGENFQKSLRRWEANLQQKGGASPGQNRLPNTHTISQSGILKRSAWM